MTIIRSELKSVRAVPHGSTHKKDLLDFSSSVIPLELPLLELMHETEFFRYPDSESQELRNSISQHSDVHASNVICGNGASELLWLVGMACISSNTKVGTLAPTFGEYARITAIMGGQLCYFPLQEHLDFKLDERELSTWIRNKNIQVFFLCNPNNPTGRYVSIEHVELLFVENPECLFVFDAAYIDYTNSAIPLKNWVEKFNVIVIYSLTKAFGIAGIRSGYALANEAYIEALNKVKPAWNLNALAQTASKHLFDKRNKYSDVAKEYRDQTIQMMATLSTMRFRIIPSDTDYFMMGVNNPKKFKNNLLEKGFLIRELESMGVPNYVRINVCDRETNSRFIETISKLFNTF